MKIELISFALCPYVQRSVITLLYKGVEFKTTYIDLNDKPEWFLKISPLGKVPVMRVNGNTVIFESAVINEFLDETHPPSLHPKDPVRRAHNRAWIEFGSTLLVDLFHMLRTTNRSDFSESEVKLFDKLRRLEQSTTGPYFNGDDFSLVDSAYAPLFMRLDLVTLPHIRQQLANLTRLQQWSDSLLQLPAVQQSVPDDFAERTRNYLRDHNSFLARNL